MNALWIKFDKVGHCTEKCLTELFEVWEEVREDLASKQMK